MIIFGWNHFLIRSFMPHELGLGEETLDPEFMVEARQKYFHIFWIPFFPTQSIQILHVRVGV